MAKKRGASRVAGRFIEGTPDWQYDSKTIRSVVELDDLPGWRISVLMRAIDVREVINLSIQPIGEVPTGGLTRRALDKVVLGAIVDATRVAIEKIEDAGVHMSPALKRSVGRALAANPRPGRRGFDDRHYATLADDYVTSVVIKGHSLARFAESFGVNVARMRNMLTTARKRDLLTAAPKGRAGGHLTDKAIDLLNTED